MKTKTQNEQTDAVLVIMRDIQLVHTKLGRVDWYSYAHTNDPTLARHWEALCDHVDNAAGRCSTLLQHMRFIDATRS